MKTLLLIFILLSSNLLSDELKWVDEQIQAIKPPREGVSSSKINSIKNPFIFLQKNKEKPKKKVLTSTNKVNSTKVQNITRIEQKNISLHLSAIINNSAYINGKWYKIQEKVGKYTISRITRTDVILTYKQKRLLLSTRTKSKTLKFKNK